MVCTLSRFSAMTEIKKRTPLKKVGTSDFRGVYIFEVMNERYKRMCRVVHIFHMLLMRSRQRLQKIGGLNSMPKWNELKRYCERDGWELYKETDHYFL